VVDPVSGRVTVTKIPAAPPPEYRLRVHAGDARWTLSTVLTITVDQVFLFNTIMKKVLKSKKKLLIITNMLKDIFGKKINKKIIYKHLIPKVLPRLCKS
jgi:hypothetical protein